MTNAMIIQETSLMSWVEIEPLTGDRQYLIYDTMLRAGRPLTAREVLVLLGKYDMNYVRPRIHELYKAGRIRAAGRVFDAITNRTVLCWQPIIKM